MTPIQFALAEIRSEIPEEILELAFIPKTKYAMSRRKNTTVSIDQRIIDLVINDRIRRHIDAQGARQITVNLDGLNIEKINGSQAWMCHIPKTRTGGKTITHAISVHVGILGNSYSNTAGIATQYGLGMATSSVSSQCGVDTNLRGARAILDANRPLPMNYTSNVYLIDENTIYCEDYVPLGSLELRCQIASDYEFSFIQGQHVEVFSELCLLATQAYIYRKLSIESDKAIIDGGMELGAVKEWIDKFSDANDAFKELVTTRWAKIQKMSDKARRQRFLKSKISLSSLR